MARYTAEQKEASREAILASAARLFRLKGFEGVGIPEIAQGAGLTHGTFYAHFESKDALLGAVIEQAKAQRASRIRATGLKGLERAKAIVSYYLSEEHALNPEQGCIVPGLGADLSRKRGEVGPEACEYVELFVAELVSSGLRRPFARALAATMVGGVIQARLVGKDSRSETLKDIRQECLRSIDQENGK